MPRPAPPCPTRSTFSLHLDQQGAGPAVALLRSNLMRTRYCLAPAPGCAWLHRVLAGAGYGPEEELAAAPPALAGVRYKIRVRGMMMPRRCAAPALSWRCRRGEARRYPHCRAAAPPRASARRRCRSAAGHAHALLLMTTPPPRRMFIELPCAEQLHSHPTYPEVPPHLLGALPGAPLPDAPLQGLAADAMLAAVGALALVRGGPAGCARCCCCAHAAAGGWSQLAGLRAVPGPARCLMPGA